MTHRASLGISIAALALAISGQAFAQTTSGAQAASGDEVIVTAQRRAQNIREVPLSVTAITGRTVEDLNLRDPRDLAIAVPGFSYQSATSTSTASLFIRGVGIGDFNANTTGAVGVYRDDVFVGANSGKLIDMFDAERIEVLEGPQGTLYGRNTTGGAIRFISRKPTDHPEGDLTLSYGRFNERIVEGGLGGALVKGLLKGRIAGLYQQRDGTTLNRVTGHHVNDIDMWALRGIVDLTPRDGVLLRATVHGGENRSGARQFQHRGQGYDLFGDPAALPDGTPLDGFGYADTDHDPDAGDYDIEGKDRLDTFGAALTAQVTLPGAELTGITAWETSDHHLLEDTDASPNNVVTGYYVDRPRQFSQEVRLRTTGTGPLTTVAGLYYFDETLVNDSAFDVLRVTRDPSLPLGGFDPMLGNGYQRYPSREHTTSYAAFAQADYRLTPHLTVTAGARYTRDRIRFAYKSYFDEPSGVYPLVDIADSRTFSDVSWRGALTWTKDATTAYASVTKGYNGGGFPSGLANYPQQLAPFRSEHLYATEAGIRTQMMGDRLQLSAAIYDYAYKALQVFVFDTSSVIPLQRKTNAGDADITGLEASLTARPTSRLQVTVGANLLHAVYRSFTALSAADYSGNRLVNAPDLTVTGSISYTHPIGAGSVVARLDGRYQSQMFLNPDNAAGNRVAPYGIADARLAWRLPGDRGEIAAFVRNLTDTRALTYVAPIITQDELNYTDPRTYGLQLSLRFR